jgi:dimethylaniline monooxygenase (N-oxide forming)
LGENKSRKIAVIGAGAAGLISAKTLSQAGVDVTIFEIGTCIGGMWDANNDNGLGVAYNDLHINTDTYLTQLKDYPFKLDASDYANHTEMHEYLCGYAKNFGVDSLIRFKSKVTKIDPIEEGRAGWNVTINDGDTERYDGIVIATGHLHAPRLPDLPGLFGGELIHAASYRNPKPFFDKRVCVLGFGNSALDIATDLAHVAKKMVVSARTGAFVWPKYAFGYPLTRVAGKVHEIPLLTLGMKLRLARLLNGILVRMVWGRMSDYGITLPEKTGHPISNQFFLSHLKYGRIILKRGIEKIKNQTIYFDDGTEQEFDTIIAATGYTVKFPFLESARLGNDDTLLPLYNRVVPPDLPGLYFVGYFNLDWASNPVYEQQAIWIRNIETGQCHLPSSEEMWREVHHRQRMIKEKFHNAPRMNLEVQYGPYVRELKQAQKYKNANVGSRTP